MNQEKIGKFISKCRKSKKLTQEKLSEKLGVSDRAVSKWERGINLPDTSIMLNLCEILEINVNELLTGELIEKKDYMKKAEENLIELKKHEEEINKKMLMYENVIGFTCTSSFLVLLFTGVYAVNNIKWRIILFSIAFILLIVGVTFALKIETEAGYYECKHCNNKYVPTFSKVYLAMHIGRTRYLKCPKCNKRSWNKKVLSK